MNETIEITKRRIDGILNDKDSIEKWTDWKWQVSHSIKDIFTVEKILGIEILPDKKERILRTIEKFPMSITP